MIVAERGHETRQTEEPSQVIEQSKRERKELAQQPEEMYWNKAGLII
jgi:hypothetical protein